MKRSPFSRFFSGLLAVIMVLSLIPVTSIAADSATATLVTSVADLKAGDQVVIAASNADFALSTNQKTNNREGKAITRDGDQITFGDDIQVLTLEATESAGIFGLNTGSGYLYAASTTKNQLKTQAALDANASWKIEISSSGAATVTAQGSNTRNLMRYNPNGGAPLFAAYGSGQQDISIYKIANGPEDPIPDNMIESGVLNLQQANAETAENVTVMGQVVYHYGKVFNGNESLNSIILEDVIDGEIVGFQIYDYNDYAKYKVGDIVKVTGNITLYNGVMQMSFPTMEVVQTGVTPIEAQEVTVSELGADYLSEYVYIKDVTLGTYNANNTTVTDATGTINLYGGAPLPADTVEANVTGVYGCCSAYKTTYQLRNGTGADYVVGGGTTEPPVEPSEPTGTAYAKTASIAAGDKVVIFNAESGMLLSSTKSGYKLVGVGATDTNGVITTADPAVVWTVGVQDGKYTFTQDNYMLGMVQSGNYVNLSTNASDGNIYWELSAGTGAHTWYAKNTGIPAGNYGPYYLEWFDGFTAYGSNSPSDGQFGVVFYKEGGTPAVPPVDPSEPTEPSAPTEPSEPSEPDVTPEGTAAYLVTDVADLAVGDQIVLVCPSSTAIIGPSAGNFYASVTDGVTLSSDNQTVYFDEDLTQILTLGEGTTSGTWSMDASGAYLAAVTGGKNYLKNETAVSAFSSWTIEISKDGVATIKSKTTETDRNWIRYNPTSPRFSCYKSGQSDVAIYKVPAVHTGKVTSVDQFVSGTYAMVVDGGYAMGNLDGSWISVVRPSIDGDQVTDAKGGVWTLTVEGDKVTITDANGSSVKPKGGNTNGIASGAYGWQWTFDEKTQTFTFAGTGSDTVKLASNANEDPTYGGFHKFRAYKNSTISGNPATYPVNFTLYAIAKENAESSLPVEGAQVVIYNVSAQGVLAAENDTQSINGAAAEIVDGKAIPANGGVVFTVEYNGDYVRFKNEKYGYLCSNGTGNNAFYSETASEDADWKLTYGKKGGYNMESRTAKFNGTYSQYLEYYADAYKTYSMYNVTDYDIYEFFFYEVGSDVKLTEGIVNMPVIDFGILTDAYIGSDYTFSFTVDAVFGVDGELEVTAGKTLLTKNDDGSYTVPADKISGTELVLTVYGKDTVGTVIAGSATVTVKDEPTITDVTPGAGVQTGKDLRPVISAKVNNAGADPKITVTINDEAVDFVYANGVVTYTPTADMPEGRTAVTVKVVRADGKEAVANWSFTVGVAQYQLYFGQLHSHTTYSDGSGSLDSALDYIKNLPESANVDFVAFTDHSNYFDTTGAANPAEALWDTSKATAASMKLWDAYTGAIDDFNASQSNVIALAGFEMTWSGGPGHINTFNTPGIVSRNNSTLNNKTNDAGMKAYYELLSRPEGAEALSQFNHPGSTFGTFTDFAYWDAVLDTRIQMVEVGNGEGQIGAGGYYPSYEYYTMALDKGWHVAPTNNQDNHKGKWGNANNARDVILTDDFSEAGIYQAIRDMRMYATEDKNLEIYYNVNGLPLGSSITEVPEKLNLSVTVYDPDKSDSISKVEVIVNSGKVAYTWSDPAVLATGALEVTLDPTYSYYYIRVTEGDGDLAVTSPVWVGESLKLGISSLTCGTSTPVTNEELTLTTTLFNSESKAARVKSVTYTANGGEVIATDTTGYSIPAGSTFEIKQKLIPTDAKVTTITATVVMDLDGEEFTFTMDITLDVQDADKLVYIGIDASHYNEYVNGNYKDSMGNFGALAAEYSVRTVTLMESADLIAACANPKYKALILTAPSRRSSEAQAANPLKVYTAEELAAIKAFNEAGGIVILAGWSDHYENYPDVASIAGMKANEHMAATQNAVLEALGSSLRIGDDATYDDAHNGGQAYRLYFNTYGDSILTEGVEVDPENPHDRLYTEVFSYYGGASVYTVDGTVPSTVTPVVYGHKETYSVDVDKDGLGGTSMFKYPVAEGDNRLMAVATEQLAGRGLIVVSGAAFMSNFEVQATIEDSGAEKNYSNYKICENLLGIINPVQVSDIADVQAQTGVGYKYTIEGIVTSNASGFDKDTAFFDCIYVQDETAGVCCFPVAGNYKIGDKVRVTGTTEFYQGEMELQVTSIEVIGSGTVEPKEVTAKQVNDLSVLGQLIKVKGTVVSFQKENGLVQTILVKDAKGDVCRVFIDGYITTDEDVKDLSVGCEITVTGISSYDNTFAMNATRAARATDNMYPRIRIRDRADIVCKAAPATPPTGDNSQPVLMLGIMLAAVLGMGVTLVAKKKFCAK